MRTTDLVTGLILFAFGLAVYFASMSYSFGQMGAPGPAFVPRLAALTLMGLSIFIIISTLKKRTEPSEYKFFPTRDAPKRVIIAVAAFVMYRFCFPVFGLVITNFVFFLLITRFLGRHSWTASIAFSLLASASSFLLFQVWLRVPMPTSIFGF